MRLRTTKRWWRVLVRYRATKIMLIVWGKDAEDAARRAEYAQRGAHDYIVQNEVDGPYGDQAIAGKALPESRASARL